LSYFNVLTCRPTWPGDQPAHLASIRQPGSPVLIWACLFLDNW